MHFDCVYGFLNSIKEIIWQTEAIYQCPLSFFRNCPKFDILLKLQSFFTICGKRSTNTFCPTDFVSGTLLSFPESLRLIFARCKLLKETTLITFLTNRKAMQISCFVKYMF